jgi:hypothetical protein
MRKKKTWVFSPPQSARPPVPDAVKAELEAKAAKLVEAELKPRHIEPPPEDARFNYITDIYTKWYRSYFYFCSTYCCPGPNAVSPSFESCFARLEYAGHGRFNLSFMRHTGKWWEMYTDFSVDDCLAAIRDEPPFLP